MFATILFAIETLFCTFTAVYSATLPTKFAATLGLGTIGSAGINEVRAQYAGFFAAVALVLGAAMIGKLATPTGLLVGAMVFGGLIAGRLAATLINGGVAGYTPTLKALLVIDSVGLAANIWALTS